MDDYRIVVGIEFGTTHSGFGFAHTLDKENVIVSCGWPGGCFRFKVPTVLSYDDEYKNVQSWGYSALGGKIKIKNPRRKPVELFKLLLGKMENEPPLPHEKAISDYLHELGRFVKKEIDEHYAFVDLYNHVLIILTVPDNYKISVRTMRECAFKAGLLNDQYSQNLKLITESEATTLYYMKILKEHNISVGEKFIVVECGDDKVSLTRRMLLRDEILSIILEKTEDNCGNSIVYQEFLKFLEHKVGSSAINPFSERHKSQLQYLQSIILDQTVFPYLIDLEEDCPALMKYCKGEYRDNMIESEWQIELKFDDVKAMFDPIIEKIIQLIDFQLNLCNDDCFALIFVGEFPKSEYLQLRIEEIFCSRVQYIHIPHRFENEVPIIKGAVQYGLMYDIIDDISNSNIQFHLSQAIKIFEEKKKLQDENKYNNLKGNYNDLTNKYNEETNQHQIIVENLENDVKGLENQIEDINQQYQNKIKLQEQKESQMQIKLKDEIQASNNNLNKYKLLYDNLQEKYDDLTNKYNDETNQHQIIVENLKIEFKGIEDKYLKNIQQLENENKDIIQQVDQLQQSFKLKEIQLQSSEKEKKELDTENDYLYQKNTNLINQLENTSFEDELSNYKLDDVAQNYVIKLIDDISKLNDNLKKYVTNLNQQDVIVNVEEIRKLLLLYKCPVKITNQKDDMLLIQAVLQRHIIETIFSYATKYFRSTGQHYHLESDIINQASLLSTLLTDASKYRTENDEIMRISSTKLRKQIYLILNNCGFSDIHGKSYTTYEHPFITHYKEKLNKTMNELRTIKDQEKVKSENLAATIIREVIKIFWFRLKIHESVVQYAWVPYSAKVDETFMEGENFDGNDNENLYVDLCYFPLIGKDLTINKHKVYVHAKVFVRKKQHIQKD